MVGFLRAMRGLFGGKSTGPRLERALFAALRRHQMDRVRELLERGADVNQRDEDGSTPLDYAISDDDLPPELVGELLDRGAKPDATDEEGTTALMVAPTPLLPLLIAHGANVNARDRAGGTPLIQAASLGDVKRLEILLDHGAEIDATNGRSNALIAVVEAGQTETVRLLLARGADISRHPGTSGWGSS
ncbi:MAG: ankyrin repeat domain-containing protein [Isosphaeraceae bacterium]